MGSKHVSRHPLSIGTVDILNIFPTVLTVTTLGTWKKNEKNFLNGVQYLHVQNTFLKILYRLV